MAKKKTLLLGTRGSQLALWQSRHVKSLLDESGQPVELVIIRTEGDKDQSAPLANIGGQGVFTKGIQDALLERRIDIAVHSLKDLPTLEVPGLQISAVPGREDPRDVLIAHSCDSFDALPDGAKIGTGSIRRQAQLLHLRPDLKMQEIRGNVDTRVKKILAGEFDAIVLAAAGLTRLGLLEHVTEFFAEDRVLPAVGQGALGIETRSDDDEAIAAVAILNDDNAFRRVMAERQMLRRLQGGCLAPIGTLSRIRDNVLTISGVVLSNSGDSRIQNTISGDAANAVDVGNQLAESLLESGAARHLG